MFSAVNTEQDEEHHVQAYIASMVQAVVSNSNQPNDNKERTPKLPLKVMLDQSSRTRRMERRVDGVWPHQVSQAFIPACCSLMPNDMEPWWIIEDLQ